MTMTADLRNPSPLRGLAVPGMGWLHSARFDAMFIGGTAALALASGLVVTAVPSLFWPVLIADLWLLGYHHVIATWSRLCFDRASIAHHARLVYALPLAVLGATAALGWVGGVGAIATVYFYWQWYHYTRQSWGIVRAYGRKGQPAGAPGPCEGRLFATFFYGIPAWGILNRMAEAPEAFLGFAFWVPPVPAWLATAVGMAAIGAGALWASEIWRGKRPHLAPAEGFYLIIHIAIFATAYVFIGHIDHGWLVVNIWHNAQYVLFVWLFNRKRFQQGVIRADSRFALSWLSQPRRIVWYMLASVAVSSVVYLAIMIAASGLAVAAVPVALVVFQAINFHHYIVDGLIWARGRRAPPETLRP